MDRETSWRRERMEERKRSTNWMMNERLEERFLSASRFKVVSRDSFRCCLSGRVAAAEMRTDRDLPLPAHNGNIQRPLLAEFSSVQWPPSRTSESRFRSAAAESVAFAINMTSSSSFSSSNCVVVVVAAVASRVLS